MAKVNVDAELSVSVEGATIELESEQEVRKLRNLCRSYRDNIADQIPGDGAHVDLAEDIEGQINAQIEP